MTTELTTVDSTPAALLEKVLVRGDLSTLSAAERLEFYQRTCDSLRLNMLTRPFAYITLNGKLTLYATRDATDQLRANNNVSVQITSRERLDEVYVVTARATLPNGRTDESIGAVSIAGLKGDALANAIMKAETKSKRRVTLSIVGLGMLDETETETIPGARPVHVDLATGEIVGQPAPASPSVLQRKEQTAAELAKQAVARGLWDAVGARAWCEARGVTKIDQAPERDRVELAHELANRLAARE